MKGDGVNGPFGSAKVNHPVEGTLDTSRHISTWATMVQKGVKIYGMKGTRPTRT